MQGSTIDPSKTSLNYHHEVEAAEVHHEEHPDFRMFGLVVFLAADSMTFLGMFAAFLIYKATMPAWPPEGTELELLVPTINTIILITSSFVMHRGQSAIKKNDVSGLRLWFGITALMGAMFLAGQVYEYTHVDFGLTTNLFTSSFFALTGFHGLHVSCGLALILFVLLRSLNSKHYSSEEHFGVEAAELYWHFVDVVWIVLFVIVYLIN
ncbi:MAG: heme-copper oxidase subunit III [Moorea sp. SIO4G2]|uniref:Oxidase aa(3) subunit 3 n=1 Tax=Moorena bouillonii PNG TaxID=568701 RepID=A0A1U7MZ78_9CYAN|nr:heme-copper oxidase subunit III [Moorena bouillonii]NEO66576.1 heme-copper oxidase subunit III [Moorena sp. SIO4G2]NEP51242.1 heme-copper oxidase subunit III [Moorena sp. SIO3C2]OLT58989.1 heme-copper oxidase subunit III [Moorena bouillonii PNG]